MKTYKSEFLRTLAERGFLHQCTNIDALDELMERENVTAYIGFDCTAPSLHVGSLMQIMILRWLQKCKHKPIVLLGGGTTKIGDPSGKDETRKILSDDDINANMQGIRKVFEKFVDFEEKGGNALLVNNDDWLKNLKLVDFLRDYGKHFSVNHMLSMDSVKLRLERQQNLSFLEFNYMVMQAYDFVELADKYNCRLQIGGSDQWGNIVMGIPLQDIKIRELENTHEGRKEKEKYYEEQKEKGITQDEAIRNWVKKRREENDIFGLTTPLITTASGAKMGKTAAGAIWLNEDMLSSFDYWQFWRNTEDADVGKFLRFFTELEISEIEVLEKGDINYAKTVLANEATALCHGKEAAKIAAETARKIFAEGGVSDDMPTFYIEKDVLAQGITSFELFHLAGLKESKGEAKKLIEGGGARLNNEKIGDARMLVDLSTFAGQDYIKLSAGKKQHLLLKLK